MKGTDLALLQLDSTLGALSEVGVNPIPIAAEPPPGGATAVNVGAPTDLVDVPYPRAGLCAIGQDGVLLRERQWTWWTAQRAVCPDIYGGSSSSPVLDPARETFSPWSPHHRRKRRLHGLFSGATL